MEVEIQFSEYYKKVMNEYKILSKAHPSPKEYMTKQWVDIMIQRIVSAEAIIANEGEQSLHESVKATLRSYALDKKRETITLLAKPLSGEENLKIIIPLEESYEVIRQAHTATKHGQPKEMEDWLVRNNFMVHSMCSAIFSKLCTKCSAIVIDTPINQNLNEQNKAIETIMFTEEFETEANKQTASATSIVNKQVDIFSNVFCTVESFQKVCSLDILNLRDNPDQFYKYLLIYQDRKTKFIQLRPLTEASETEISIELIKILMDLSCPECMVVDADNKTVFQNICVKIKKLTGSDIALALHKSENKLNKVVAANIVRWMETEGCKNWGTGCHIVQWTMNNNADSEENTPFSKMFGYRYTGSVYKSKFLLATNDFTDDENILHLDLDRDNDVVEENIDQEIQPVNNTSEKETYLVTETQDLTIPEEITELD